MQSAITKEQILKFHQTTGCALAKAEVLLAKTTPLQRAKILEAIQTQNASTRHLYDPIENDPSIRQLIQAAQVKAKALIKRSDQLKMGSCHSIWREQARILREDHGIEWFSPSQMNPHITFD